MTNQGLGNIPLPVTLAIESLRRSELNAEEREGFQKIIANWAEGNEFRENYAAAQLEGDKSQSADVRRILSPLLRLAQD